VSRTIVSEVVEAQRARLLECVRKEARYAQAASLAGGGTESVICVPIVVGHKVRAVLYADRNAPAMPFTPEDLHYAVAATDLAAATIRMDDLEAEAADYAWLSGRLEAAREIQNALLPQPLPQPGWGAVAAGNSPAEQVSGDIYEVALDADGRFVVALADVSGKGVPAALVTAVVQSTLRLSVAEGLDLPQIIERLNTMVDTQTRGAAFVTMVLCRWSADGRTVEIANAGHPAPLWLRDGQEGVAAPERVGVALGVARPWIGTVQHFDTADSWALLLYSDGVTEARSRGNAEYGTARLVACASRGRGGGPQALVDAVADDVRQFVAPREPGDDVTLVAVQRPAAP
jgi:sigma-B regulation protein RsbU (phosphoserine phosphatase)